jgi:1-pyrroline-5-carboxylate dehydrogenase
VRLPSLHLFSSCTSRRCHPLFPVVSNDIRFTQHILGSTVNGTTYAGIHARTTGAPQNHWCGRAG